METHKYDALMKINHWISAIIISDIHIAEIPNNIEENAIKITMKRLTQQENEPSSK